MQFLDFFILFLHACKSFLRAQLCLKVLELLADLVEVLLFALKLRF